MQKKRMSKDMKICKALCSEKSYEEVSIKWGFFCLEKLHVLG